jgi:multiple sugar transport system substrate-binding protein
LMRTVATIVAAILVLTPLDTRAADLVVWWEKGFYPQEDAAVREIVAAFEQRSGKQLELVFYPQEELPDRILAALEAGNPPDFAWGFWLSDYIGQWALEDRLVDLTDAVGNLSDLFDPAQLDRAILRNGRTEQKTLYGLPMGQNRNYIHVWKNLLTRAGLSLDSIPKDWEAFWSFWCDKVQPGVRKALGRDDIWGLGLAMSAGASDTETEFAQFVDAYQADYVTADGRLVIDDSEVRRKLIRAIDGYTAIYRKGCTPPDSVSWANIDNNKRFLAQSVVMTPNDTLSIVNALKHERPDDYYENPQRSSGRSVQPESRFRSKHLCSKPWFLSMVPTLPPPSRLCAFWLVRGGSPTISIFPASGCCRRCQSCWKARSGSILATPITWRR